MRRAVPLFVVIATVLAVGLVACGGAPADVQRVPDTAVIAFSDGGFVWTIRADGSQRRRLPFQGSSPDWSPRGKIVVDGCRVVTLQGVSVDLIRKDCGDPDWSPGGKRIAFVGSLDYADAVEEFDWSPYLWIGNATTGAVRRLVTDSAPGSPSWSPDGTRIVMISYLTHDLGSMVSILDLRTGRIDRRFAYGARAVAWSPRGGEIAYSDGHQIVVTDTKGEQHRVIASSSSGWYLDEPAWSPDGQRIAYAVRDSERSHGLRVVNADGSNDRFLTGSGSHPDWKPR